MSKKVKTKKKKDINLTHEKKEEKSLVIVEKKKLSIAIIDKKDVIVKTIKSVSILFIMFMVAAYIALMLLVATIIFYVSHMQNGLIQKGVYISGIEVSNLSQEEALNAVTQGLNDSIPEYIILKYEDNNYRVNLQELELNFDVETSVTQAYSIGRTQNVVKDLWDYAKTLNDTVNIEANLNYNETALNESLKQIEEQLPNKVQEYSYEIQDNFLVINKGKSGIGINMDELKSTIVSNLENRNYDEQIEIPTYEILPKDIDLQVIHDEVYCEPQNAYYTENPTTVYEQKIGVDFDIQNAQNIILNNPDLEKYEIELILTNPDICVKDLNVFPDTLSTFSTNYTNNANRTTNLIIASSKISGTVLMPGETFSFNNIVGERTVARGYKNAAIFVNGQVEEGLAGGICQVSSTLYNAVVDANLEITERHNHSKLTSYLSGGKDATVVWKIYDLKFVNNREYPIKIEMCVQNGVISATVYGIKSSEEYNITIESQYIGVSGAYKVYNAYKVYCQNGVELRREFLSRDLYK